MPVEKLHVNNLKFCELYGCKTEKQVAVVNLPSLFIVVGTGIPDLGNGMEKNPDPG